MSRTLNRLVTFDEADRELLDLANEKGKFALDILGIDDEDLQLAFERGIDQDWFTLVDVSYISVTSHLMRIFKLTEAGEQRLKELDFEPS